MATRLYFPASGTPPLASLARDTNWELPTPGTAPSVARLPSAPAKSATALATSTLLWPATTTQQWCWWQFQSPPLSAAFSFTTAHTISMVIGKCGETTLSDDTHLAFSLRVVSKDGSTVRGTLKLQHATSNEFPVIASAATRIHSALAFTANINALEGDRLILEIGLHGVTPAAENVQMRVGDPAGSTDFALTADLTTDLCPWWEISANVTFGDTGRAAGLAALQKESTARTAGKATLNLTGTSRAAGIASLQKTATARTAGLASLEKAQTGRTAGLASLEQTATARTAGHALLNVTGTARTAGLASLEASASARAAGIAVLEAIATARVAGLATLIVSDYVARTAGLATFEKMEGARGAGLSTLEAASEVRVAGGATLNAEATSRAAGNVALEAHVAARAAGVATLEQGATARGAGDSTLSVTTDGRVAGLAELEAIASARTAGHATFEKETSARVAGGASLERTELGRTAGLAGLTYEVVDRLAGLAGLDKIMAARCSGLVLFERTETSRVAGAVGLTKTALERCAGVADLTYENVGRAAGSATLLQTYTAESRVAGLALLVAPGGEVWSQLNYDAINYVIPAGATVMLDHRLGALPDVVVVQPYGDVAVSFSYDDEHVVASNPSASPVYVDLHAWRWHSIQAPPRP